MSWTRSVFSSHVKSVGWDDDTNEIIVEWENGRTSAYAGADEATALALANAPSVGQMLHNEIKGRLSHRYV